MIDYEFARISEEFGLGDASSLKEATCGIIEKVYMAIPLTKEEVVYLFWNMADEFSAMANMADEMKDLEAQTVNSRTVREYLALEKRMEDAVNEVRKESRVYFEAFDAGMRRAEELARAAESKFEEL